MIALKNIQNGLSKSFSQLVMTLAVSAWMLALQACLLHDEAGATPISQVSNTQLSSDNALGHQDHDLCESPLRWRSNAGVQLVAVVAPDIKALAMPPNVLTVIPVLLFDTPVRALEGVSARTDTHPYRYDHSFASFWSHAPPTDHA